MVLRLRSRLAGIAVLSLAALAVAGCGPNDGTSSSSNGYSSNNNNSDSGPGETTTYTVDQQVRTIALDGQAGKVRVTAKDGPISITERAVYTGSKPVTRHEVAGDTLNLREEGCPDRPVNARCQVAWEITAPAATVLDLRTRAGGIELRAMAADVTAENNSGGVQGRELTSRRVSASSNAGGIELDFTQPPDQVSAEGNAGGIDITVPSGTSYAVEADTNAGKSRIDVPRDSASPHKIRAEMNAGGIEIRTTERR